MRKLYRQANHRKLSCLILSIFFNLFSSGKPIMVLLAEQIATTHASFDVSKIESGSYLMIHQSTVKK